MLTDPVFYAAAVPAVLLFGIAKGGFGGVLGVAAVPIMALVMSPVQAAGILLPILCLMDLIGLWAYRGKWVWPELKLLLPASLVGITVGTLLFGFMSAAVVRLIVGGIALAFILNSLYERHFGERAPKSYLPRAAGIFGAAGAGFTSFVAHAGGPPLTMYLLRRPLNKTEFVATSTVFFTVVNYAKLLPYGMLGQLSTDNLLASAVLAPLAPIGIALGVWLHRHVSDRFFFRFAYVGLFVISLKLISDGLSGV
ncbi:MAG TPA: sulfite exporter TauE/SafE family protein [Woeseiaceae bacterium]